MCQSATKLKEIAWVEIIDICHMKGWAEYLHIIIFIIHWKIRIEVYLWML